MRAPARASPSFVWLRSGARLGSCLLLSGLFDPGCGRWVCSFAPSSAVPRAKSRNASGTVAVASPECLLASQPEIAGAGAIYVV
jgi:hypothetical protein